MGSNREGQVKAASKMRVLRKSVRNETARDRLRLEPVLKKVEWRRECWKKKVESRKGSVVEKVT